MNKRYLLGLNVKSTPNYLKNRYDFELAIYFDDLNGSIELPTIIRYCFTSFEALMNSVMEFVSFSEMSLKTLTNGIVHAFSASPNENIYIEQNFDLSFDGLIKKLNSNGKIVTWKPIYAYEQYKDNVFVTREGGLIPTTTKRKYLTSFKPSRYDFFSPLSDEEKDSSEEKCYLVTINPKLNLALKLLGIVVELEYASSEKRKSVYSSEEIYIKFSSLEQMDAAIIKMKEEFNISMLNDFHSPFLVGRTTPNAKICNIGNKNAITKYENLLVATN